MAIYCSNSSRRRGWYWFLRTSHTRKGHGISNLNIILVLAWLVSYFVFQLVPPLCLPGWLPLCLPACVPLCLPTCVPLCSAACRSLCLKLCLSLCLPLFIHFCPTWFPTLFPTLSPSLNLSSTFSSSSSPTLSPPVSHCVAHFVCHFVFSCWVLRMNMRPKHGCYLETVSPCVWNPHCCWVAKLGFCYFLWGRGQTVLDVFFLAERTETEKTSVEKTGRCFAWWAGIAMSLLKTIVY